MRTRVNEYAGKYTGPRCPQQGFFSFPFLKNRSGIRSTMVIIIIHKQQQQTLIIVWWVSAEVPFREASIIEDLGRQ